MLVRIVLAALLSGIYIAGSHWLMTSAPPSPWNAVALLAPMLLAAAFSTWQAGQRGRSLLALGAACALALSAASGVQVPAPWLYLSQHVGINLMLAVWFAASLRRPGGSLITDLAARVHRRRLTPAMVAYTRNVTRAWVVYFGVVASLSLAVFAAASFSAWAVFSNLLTPVALVAMFVGERLLRYRLHPEFDRSSIVDTIRVCMQGNSAAPIARRDPLA